MNIYLAIITTVLVLSQIARVAQNAIQLHRQKKAIPAADVAPVRHGRWKKGVGENGVTSACFCSMCGFEDSRYELFNFCPNCGADMRGDT